MSRCLGRNPQSAQNTKLFAYDWLGNTSQSTDDAGVIYDRSLGTVTYGSATAGPNQLVSAGAAINATYDAAGNLQGLTLQRPSNCSASDGRCTHRFAYDWDEVGRLSRARRWDFAAISAVELAQSSLPSTTPDIDLRYSYGLGGRVLKTATAPDGTTSDTVEIFNSLRLNRTSFDSIAGDYKRSAAMESVNLGGMARIVHAPGLPTGAAGNPQHVLLRFSDWLGSATSVIDKDTSELVEKVTYQAYGATESDYRPPRWDNNREDFRFSGKEDDFSVGLTFFGEWYYHAALGRWASADPLAIQCVGGGLNPYQYIGSSPHNGVDALGLCTECDDSSSNNGGDPIVVQIGGPTSGSSSGSAGTGHSSGSGGGTPVPPPPPVSVVTEVLDLVVRVFGGSESESLIFKSPTRTMLNEVVKRFSPDNIHNRVNKTVHAGQDFLVDRFDYWCDHPDEYVAGFEDKAYTFFTIWQLLALSRGGSGLTGPALLAAGGVSTVPAAVPALLPPIFAATKQPTFPKPTAPSSPTSAEMSKLLGWGRNADVPGLQQTFTKEFCNKTVSRKKSQLNGSRSIVGRWTIHWLQPRLDDWNS